MIRQTEYLHILAAACPATGQAEGMFISSLDSEVMTHFMSQISHSLPIDKPIIFILDRAGYHRSKRFSSKHLPHLSSSL